MEVVAELSVLALAMFLAAFFCLRVLLLPDNAAKSINKIHEVEELLSDNK